MDSNQSASIWSTLMVNTNLKERDFTPLQKRFKDDPKGVGREFEKFLDAGAKMPFSRHIDMDVPSKKAPSHWTVRAEDQLPNVVRGQWEFDPAKVKLHLSEKQTMGKCYMVGNDLKVELAKLEGQEVYNDNLLDWYLDHEDQIPCEMRGKATFFWGRIYRGPVDLLYVRYLCVNGDGSCIAHYRYLDDYFRSGNPAAVAGKLQVLCA